MNEGDKLYRVHVNDKYWGTRYGKSAEDVMRQVNEWIGYSEAADKTILVHLDMDSYPKGTPVEKVEKA